MNTEAMWFESLSAQVLQSILRKKDILTLVRQGKCTSKAARTISAAAFGSLVHSRYIYLDKDTGLYRITNAGKEWSAKYPLDDDIRWHVEFSITDSNGATTDTKRNLGIFKE